MKRKIFILPAVLVIAACGGGGGGSGAPAQGPVQDAGNVRGVFTKGPVSGATVSVYVFDRDGEPTGSPVATATTDSSGSFTLTAVPQNEPYLVVSGGGRFVDESDKLGQRRVVLAADEGLESILPAGARQVALNSYTQALVDKMRNESGADSFLSLLASSRAIFTEAFGFDVLTTLSGSPIAPAGSVAAVDYAMGLGGAANAMGAIVAQTGGDTLTFEAIRVFSQDLSDGTLDGQSAGQPLTHNGQPVGAQNINLEIERFRNNNDAAYRGLPPLRIDLSALGRTATPDPLANRSPVAVGDSFSLAEGGVLNAAAPGVLVNDSDADGDVVTAVLVTAPLQAASFTLNADGSFDYTHDGSETTADSFSYSAADAAAQSTPVTVSLSISAVNDAPVVANNTGITVQARSTVPIGSAALAATDPDTAASSLVFSVDSPPVCGGLSVAGAPAASFTQADIDTNQLVFDASNCNASADIALPLTLSDGVENLSFTFSVTVTPPPNTAPTGNADNYAVDESASLVVAAPGVLANDTDVDGDDLESVLQDAPTNAASFSLDTDGSFAYQHDGSETTSDSFTYRVDDNEAVSAAITVSITINPINDPPVVNTNQPAYVDAAASVVISNAELQASDGDHAAADLNFVITAPPSCGDFEVAGAPVASFTQAQIDAGQLSFNAALCAADQDIPTGLDLSDVAGGGPVSLSFVVTVNGPANQPPVNTLPPGPIAARVRDTTPISGVSVADPDAVAASDNLSFTFSVGQGQLSFRTDVSGGLLAGDLGGTNNTATVVINTTLNRLNATLAAADGLSYQPLPGFSGVDTLQLDSNDNGNAGSGGAQSDVDLVTLAVRRFVTETPSAGMQLNFLGDEDGKRTGAKVSGIGDFNGDGFDDLLIAEGKNGGEFAYVVFGQSPVPGVSERLVDLGTPAANIGGFKLDFGDDSARFGRGVAGGDFNDDGFADLMISAERADGDTGPVFVVFGTATPPTSSLDMAQLNGANGFRLDSDLDDIHLGSDLAFGGDMSGDGIADLLIGAHHGAPGGKNKAGMAFIVFGTAASMPAEFSLEDLDGTNGVRIDGAIDSERAGDSVTVVDINGDGLSDAVLGAPKAAPGGIDSAGRIYVVFGSAIAGGAAVIDLAALTPAQGTIIDGETQDGQLGKTLAGLGDINGDALADLAFGQRSPDAAAYVLFGSAVHPASQVPSTMITGGLGFRIEHTGLSAQSFGRAVSGVGDINADGLADLAISDTLASPVVEGVEKEGVGETFILLGRSLADPPFPSTLSIDGDDGSNTLWLPGVVQDSNFGEALAPAGDFDGDGRPDFMIGAPVAKVEGQSFIGIVYLIFGL